jgi:hypothetical protein
VNVQARDKRLRNYYSAPNYLAFFKRAERVQYIAIVETIGAAMISEESVRELYQECLDALVKSGLGGGSMYQVTRGVTQNGWKSAPRGNNPSGNICRARMVAFNTYNIIPEYCFGCYKVVIEPRNVVELFKLMALIDEISLPNDNTRKCLVEVRPIIDGYYKGFVYCQDLSEGRDLLERMKMEVAEGISEGVTVALKRGCTEYRVAYPEYGAFDLWKSNHQEIDHDETEKRRREPLSRSDH